MTTLKQLPKEQQEHLNKMVGDLISLDDKMLESLEHIKTNYKNHKAFLLDFEKGKYTVEQLQKFLANHKQKEET